MKCSEQLDKLAAALAKTQAELAPALKDRKANYGNYADLSSVWEACRVPLTANGLSVLQGLGRDDRDGFLWTMLLHSSGQYVTGECPLILGKRDPQGVGAAVTYYRRYGLAAILGITQEDDDAQSAMPSKPKPAATPAPAPTAKPQPAALSAAFEFHKKALENTPNLADLAAAFGKAKVDMDKMSEKEKADLIALKEIRKGELSSSQAA